MEYINSKKKNPSAPPTLSFKHRLRQSLSSSCCFATRRTHLSPSSEGSHEAPPHSYEVRQKCRNALGGAKKKCSSADFRYDPLSYALNFEDDGDDAALLRNFSARLPPSPAVSTAIR